MSARAKGEKFFWLLNLLVILIVAGIVARTFLMGTGSSEYQLFLNEVSHYVTEGFSLEPDLSKAAEFPPGSSPKGTNLGGEKHSFLKPGDMPSKEYTITAFFDYTRQYEALLKNPNIIPGIFISRLGDNYEIYINGNKIISEWHVKDGNIKIHKLARDIVLPININFLKSGENTIIYRIYGDPTTVDTGLNISDKYALDDINALKISNTAIIIFAGIYLAVAVVFAVFFLLYKEKRQNLWFSLTALGLSLYTLFRANVFADLILDYNHAICLEVFLLYSFAYFATVLIYSCGKNKFNIIMKIFTVIYAVFCAALFLPGREFLVNLIALYYVFLGPTLIYTFISSLCIPLYKEIRRSKSGRGTALRIISGSLRGNMTLAAILPIFMSIADQLAFIILPHQDTILSQYGFLFFFVNVTYAIASDNAKAHGKLVSLSAELRSLINERENELRKKSGEVEEVKNSRLQLLETVSGEIRAPLGEIIGAIELKMLKSGLPAEEAGWLARILEVQRGIRKKLDFIYSDETGYMEGENIKQFFDKAEDDFNKSIIKPNPGGTRHLFVINPKSFVTLADLKNLLLSIEKCFSAGHRAEYKIYISRFPRDAYSAVHRYLSATPPDETARVYAVGGDGILFDCLNGLAKFPNAELAPIPYGNANDFARSFGAENVDLFRNINLMSKSPSRPADVILCGEQYALCSCSIGIEARAVQASAGAIEKINTSRARSYVPLLYTLGAIAALFDGNAMNYRLTIDGKDYSGNYLLINAGNIALNGGGNVPNPFASPEDGLIDVILCKSASILNSLMMLPNYTAGQFLKFSKYFKHYRFKEMHCESDEIMSVILDGETFYTHKLDIKILPKAINVVSPNGIGFADFSRFAKGAAK